MVEMTRIGSAESEKIYSIKNIPKEFVLKMLSNAIENSASDIHFQPQKDFISVSIHADKMRYEIAKIHENKEMYAKEIKSFFGFEMSLIGGIDDKRLSLPELGYDFRCVIYPVLYGENITARLLQRGKHFDIDRCGLNFLAKQTLLSSLNKKEGLILISGPTGSGKTTLLYSALSCIDRISRNILTIEDPIEYELPYVSQTSVNRKTGITFASMARAHMRATPDVILIGEIRDEESAEAAFHAANTGHLVLSTVHANSAEKVFERLEDLGISKERIKENVIFSSAQRLIPKNCTFCLQKIHLKNQEKPTYYSTGCSYCRSGISGVEMVFEYIWKEKKSEKIFEKSPLLAEQINFLLKDGKVSLENAEKFF